MLMEISTVKSLGLKRLAPLLLKSDILLPKFIKLPLLLLRKASELIKLIKLFQLLKLILNPLVLNADPFFEHTVFGHETTNEFRLFGNDLFSVLVYYNDY